MIDSILENYENVVVHSLFLLYVLYVNVVNQLTIVPRYFRLDTTENVCYYNTKSSMDEYIVV